MFGTSIHWTTFFYLLIDTFLVLFALAQSLKLKRSGLNRYLALGFLFIAYNATGGFLPAEKFPGPLILQFIITYMVAIAMCLYTVYYFYKEYDIVFLEFRLNMTNISIIIIGCFIILFLLPYFITHSLDKARLYFTVPVALICVVIWWGFFKKISTTSSPNKFISRRNLLSLIGLVCIALLPVLTLIGDYQWLTFTIVNTAFYIITAIEIDRYLYFLERKGKLTQILGYFKDTKSQHLHPKLINERLTRREIEIALSILDNYSYKKIAEDFFIVERTVSKHASNIFKKTGVKSRKEFLARFGKKRR